MYQTVKRTLEIFLAIVVLTIVSPLMAVIAIVVRCAMGGPVLFRQMRPGLNERLFACLKFRTMRDEYTDNGQILTDSERLTGIGKFLRRTSLDELPQLWNIVRGEMSFVGPRPLLPEYLPFYTEEERRRHLTRPGLTGWAQINGRNYLSFPKRLQMDVWYVDHMSWRLDLRILIATVWLVVTGKDVSSKPEECGTLSDERRSKEQSKLRLPCDGPVVRPSRGELNVVSNGLESKEV